MTPETTALILVALFLAGAAFVQSVSGFGMAIVAMATLPLVMDLTNPSPNLGWNGEERLSLVARGPCDMALALALVHHLVIGNNVPFERVANSFRELCRTLVIEFVPKEDVQVRRLLSTRRDTYSDYTRSSFEAGFSRHFEILEQRPITDSERVLYLMRTH